MGHDACRHVVNERESHPSARQGGDERGGRAPAFGLPGDRRRRGV